MHPNVALRLISAHATPFPERPKASWSFRRLANPQIDALLGALFNGTLRDRPETAALGGELARALGPNALASPCYAWMIGVCDDTGAERFWREYLLVCKEDALLCEWMLELRRERSGTISVKPIQRDGLPVNTGFQSGGTP